MDNDNSSLDGINPDLETSTDSDIPVSRHGCSNYQTNLMILLRKLRRYRWYYRQSIDYYGRYHNWIWYPTLIISAIITICGIVVGIADNDGFVSKVTNWITAFLGILIGILQKILSKNKPDVKEVKFEVAAHEIDKLIARVDFEYRFPNEEQQAFILTVEDQLLSIKDDLKYQPPEDVIIRYRKLEIEHPGDISSDEIKVSLHGGKQKQYLKGKYQRFQYDYDIADELSALKKINLTPTKQISPKQNLTKLATPLLRSQIRPNGGSRLLDNVHQSQQSHQDTNENNDISIEIEKIQNNW